MRSWLEGAFVPNIKKGVKTEFYPKYLKTTNCTDRKKVFKILEERGDTLIKTRHPAKCKRRRRKAHPTNLRIFQ
jgi:hypothetical protein